MDGGDVLVMPNEIFVGLTARTNVSAIETLSKVFGILIDVSFCKVFSTHHVISIPITGALHLKSVMSAVDENTIVIADCTEGRAVAEQITRGAKTSYNLIFVPGMA